jgi:RNA polymerase sigma-70 factor (ECF subfamily)
VNAEETILERVARGEAAAVQECINAYGDLVWSLARRYLRGDADAEDAVQDIFIDLWSSAGRFDRSVATEGAFVATIARRRLIDRVRQKGRRPGMTSIDDENTGDAWQPAVLPKVEEESDVAVVARVLEAMPAEHRQILSLSLYEGYSHGEIAERLNIPLGTVKTRVRRGLIHIREQLGIEAGAVSELEG